MGRDGGTRYARNALLLSRASREWRRIAINFLSFFLSRTHRSPSLLHPLHSSPLRLAGALSFYPQSTQFHSFWFRSQLIPCLAWAACFVRSFVRSFAHSFRMAGWRYPVQPEFASRIPLFAFQFHETLATAAATAPLPNGGYKHKYEFKGPQMTISRITSRTILCILIRSGYRGLYHFLLHLRSTAGFRNFKKRAGI